MLLATEFKAYALMFVLAFVGVMLIFIILLQRGRGGGLAGAFGGLGGQSAFGTKAGDVFTKITVAIAVVWVFLAAASGFVLQDIAEATRFPGGREATPEEATLQPTGEHEIPIGEPPMDDPEQPAEQPAQETPADDEPPFGPPADEAPAPDAPAADAAAPDAPAEQTPDNDAPALRLPVPDDEPQADD